MLGELAFAIIILNNLHSLFYNMSNAIWDICL